MRRSSKHPPVSQIYAQRLIAEGVVDQKWIDDTSPPSPPISKASSRPETQLSAQQGRLVRGARWDGLGKPGEPVDARRNVNTAIRRTICARLGKLADHVPEGLTIHKTLGRILEAKKKAFESGEGIDWATAEALAFGTLLRRGSSGPAVGPSRAAALFSQRHAVWIDQNSGDKYIPLTRVRGRPPLFEVLDSPLSEFGAGLRTMGYSLADPRAWCL